MNAAVRAGEMRHAIKTSLYTFVRCVMPMTAQPIVHAFVGVTLAVTHQCSSGVA